MTFGCSTTEPKMNFNEDCIELLSDSDDDVHFIELLVKIDDSPPHQSPTIDRHNHSQQQQQPHQQHQQHQQQHQKHKKHQHQHQHHYQNQNQNHYQHQYQHNSRPPPPRPQPPPPTPPPPTTTPNYKQPSPPRPPPTPTPPPQPSTAATAATAPRPTPLSPPLSSTTNNSESSGLPPLPTRCQSYIPQNNVQAPKDPSPPSPPPLPEEPPCTELKRSQTANELKELGNENFRKHQYKQATHYYKDAKLIAEKFQDDQMVAVLHFNLAQSYAKLGSFELALHECAQATKYKDDYLKAHLKRAELYLRQNMFDEAVICYEYVAEIDPTNRSDYEIFLADAKLKASKCKKKDHYQLLGLEKNFSPNDLRKAYRERALKHHPDRHSNTDNVSRKIEEKRFKEASEAYKILSDMKERNKYDQILYKEQRRNDCMHPYMYSRFMSRSSNERSYF